MISLNKWIFFLCVILAVVFDAILLLRPDLVAYSPIAKGAIMGLLLIFVLFLLPRRSTWSSLDIAAMLILLLIFAAYSLYSRFPQDSFDRAIKQMFVLSFYLATIYFLRFELFRRTELVRLFSFSLVIAAPATLFLTLNPHVEHLVQAGGPYTVLWALLLGAAVATGKDKLLIAAMILGSIALIISTKRGAIICLGTAMVYWIYLQNRYFAGPRTLYRTAALALVGLVVVATALAIGGEQFTERFADTSGSGRDLLYTTILEGFTSGGVLELFIGHGSMGVQWLTGEAIGIRAGQMFGLQAHNDWLTLLYDFGILGVALFVAFHAALFYKIEKLKNGQMDLFCRLRPIHAALFASSLFSELLFNTSLFFAFILLAIMSSPYGYARMMRG